MQLLFAGSRVQTVDAAAGRAVSILVGLLATIVARPRSPFGT